MKSLEKKKEKGDSTFLEGDLDQNILSDQNEE